MGIEDENDQLLLSNHDMRRDSESGLCQKQIGVDEMVEEMIKYFISSHLTIYHLILSHLIFVTDHHEKSRQLSKEIYGNERERTVSGEKR